MSDATPRFRLPFILPGQAQKELFHNEALTRLDMALHGAVEGPAIDDPPAAPGEGQSWIVGSAPTGAWAGRAHQLAMWTDGGWRFVAPTAGIAVWDKSAGLMLRWTGGGWNGGELECSALVVAGLQVVGERQPNVPSPSGGTVIDAEARAAVDAIIVALMSHGLIN